MYAHDPGGANVVASLVNPLIQESFNIYLYGQGPALLKFKDFDLQVNELKFIGCSSEQKSLDAFLEKLQPDCIVTGTSSENMIEKYLWSKGKELLIPSVVVLDQWMNFGVRFSQYKMSEYKLYEQSKKHEFLPTKIFAMDEVVKQKLIDDGIAAEMVAITGHTYLAGLAEKKNIFDEQKKTATRMLLGCDLDDFIITFASEPICQFQKDKWGYTECSILLSLLKVLAGIGGNANKKIHVIVRPHPREAVEHLENILSPFKNRINYRIEKSIPSLDLILSSDLVCGMSSMFLLEATAMQVPIMSIQIGLTEDDPFVLSQKGIVDSILDKEMLKKCLHSFFESNAMNYQPIKLDMLHNAVQNSINEIKSLLG